jgi:predicted transcriptional regulator YdeE
VQQYFHNLVSAKISNRVRPGVTFCVYTQYVSDFKGEYTYFIGEEVSSFESIPIGLEQHIIPKQVYAKFTVGPGEMPNVVKEAWHEIWNMSAQDLSGERSYMSDFEIYDERASDHANIMLDICIGIKNNVKR